jgi:hypothetical protein
VNTERIPKPGGVHQRPWFNHEAGAPIRRSVSLRLAITNTKAAHSGGFFLSLNRMHTVPDIFGIDLPIGCGIFKTSVKKHTQTSSFPIRLIRRRRLRSESATKNFSRSKPLFDRLVT